MSVKSTPGGAQAVAEDEVKYYFFFLPATFRPVECLYPRNLNIFSLAIEQLCGASQLWMRHVLREPSSRRLHFSGDFIVSRWMDVGLTCIFLSEMYSRASWDSEHVDIHFISSSKFSAPVDVCVLGNMLLKAVFLWFISSKVLYYISYEYCWGI